MGTFGRTSTGPDRLRPAPTEKTPLPVGFGLVGDRDLDRLADDRVLLGGSPARLIRLRPRAAEMTRRWLAGSVLEDRRTERLVARRLVSAGLLHPRPPAVPPGVLVTVVVPVRDRPESLRRLIDSLGEVRCVVVDDCSARGAEIEKVARDAGAEYLRLDRHSGPAAARNAGLARSQSPLVAFVDSDCTVQPRWLDGLVGHFADPKVALVAPRIVTKPNGSWLSHYEAARSPLDLGPAEGRVAAASRLAYVPSAAIVLRRSVASGRCFDERLGAGEDVDLAWRLVAAGWDVRYVPEVEVTHTPDLRGGTWLARRALYGSTAGALALRHGDAIAPARIAPATGATLALLAAGQPAAALAVGALAAIALASRLRGVVEDPFAMATRLAFMGTARSVKPLVAGMTRAWGPGLLMALGVRRLGRLRWMAGAALGITAAREWASRPPGLDAGRYVAARLADDLAYGTGVWAGCLRARTLRPLIPVITRSRRFTSGRRGRALIMPGAAQDTRDR